ncbi:MAG: glycosyltransferase family 4 protein [Solirubrobacterales bacterium]
MRIGLFSDSYTPYTSGVVTSIQTLKAELTARGHDVHVFAPEYPNHMETETNIHRFFSVPAPTNPDFTLPVPISPRMTALVKRLRLDVIHVHSPFLLGQMGMRCANRWDIPLVFTYHTKYDQYVHYFPLAQDLARDLTIRYSRYFCGKCDLVIAPSTDIESVIRGYGIRTTVRVVPTGVDTDKYTAGDPDWLRQRFHIEPDRKICLFVGRLSPEKNLAFLIEAMARVKAREKVTLVLTASGPMERELRQLAAAQGMVEGTDLIFTGFLNDEELVNAYAGSDLFTFASVTETQGVVLVEAMASGLPIAAVEASGTRDMVQNGSQGILTPVDLDQFTEAIIRLLSDSALREQMAAAGVQRAQALSAQGMAEKLENEYTRLIERNKRTASRRRVVSLFPDRNDWGRIVEWLGTNRKTGV